MKLFSRRRLKVAAFAIVLAGVALYFAREALFRGAAGLLVVRDEPLPSDAIVVLAGGVPSRSLEAVRLYKAGVAPNVLVTTETPPRAFDRLKKDGIVLSETWENYVRILVGYGVPDKHVFRVEQYSDNTFEELKLVRDFALARQWKSLVIVTSNYHSRRTRLTARLLLEPEIRASVASGEPDAFDPASWWKSRGQIRTFTIETEKLLAYGLYIWPQLIWRKF